MAAPTSSPRATVLALHHGYRTPGGEERAAEQLAGLAERELGERVSWLRRDSTRLTAGDAARGLLAGGTGGRQVSDALASSGADLLHAHNLFPTFGPTALRAARDAGAAVVVHLHNYRLVCAVATTVRDGQDCTECRRGWSTPGLTHRCRGSLPESAAYAAALPRWQKAVVELADVVIVPSVAARTRLLELGVRLPADRVHVIGGVAEQVAQRSTASTGRFALVVTRLAPEKDLKTAIDACRIAGIPLVIAGDGPERDALEAHAGPLVGGPTVAAPAVVAQAAVARHTSSVAARKPVAEAATPAPTRKPVIPPPPREFPAHNNPFLNQATPPPSKPPPPRLPPVTESTPAGPPPERTTPEKPDQPSGEPEPRAAEPPAGTQIHRPAPSAAARELEELLGSEVLALLDAPPVMRGTTIFVGRASASALRALRARARVGLATSVAHETFGLSALESMC
ncbi:MAG: glycosyltransferase, partial [Solirubrobacteraceae bacterium]|nr:glycosyltransferase [Solirubrobacteraceae bacterium]